MSLFCNSQQSDGVCDIPPIFLQTSDENQKGTAQLEAGIGYASGMFSFLYNVKLSSWHIFIFSAGATKHSVSEPGEQSQPQPNLTHNTQNQALLLPCLDDSVTTDQTVPGKC